MMRWRLTIRAALFVCLAVGSLTGFGGNRPNVLFLAVDDMRDWVACLEGYSGTVHTPNIDRLAERGVLFTNAHCPSPKCAPSRAAIMTGLMPSTTGLYDNGHWWYPNLPNVVTLPMHFRNHGYEALGAGKVFHHTAGNHPPNQWNDFQSIRFHDDPWFRGSELNYPWTQVVPFPPGFPFSQVAGLPHENDWGVIPRSEGEFDDARSADYAIRYLETARDGHPFFLACGIFRPHLPWYVPQRFLDLYPLDDVQLPSVKEDDRADIPAGGLALAESRERDLRTIRTAGKTREAVRAYLASISFADHQVGRILNALDKSEIGSNTIIVFWSDHGWHLGEKGHWHKSTLWEEATRIPFIISVPGFDPGPCAVPVSLIDLYPTLNELCGLPGIPDHDGESLVPLLANPKLERERVAVTEFRRGNAAVRSERYRYIRYADGGAELYDHRHDPHEWKNLIGESTSGVIVKRLEQHLPKSWAPSAPTKGSFNFDPDRFTWTEKSSGRVIVGR